MSGLFVDVSNLYNEGNVSTSDYRRVAKQEHAFCWSVCCYICELMSAPWIQSRLFFNLVVHIKDPFHILARELYLKEVYRDLPWAFKQCWYFNTYFCNLHFQLESVKRSLLPLFTEINYGCKVSLGKLRVEKSTQESRERAEGSVEDKFQRVGSDAAEVHTKK